MLFHLEKKIIILNNKPMNLLCDKYLDDTQAQNIYKIYKKK